MGILNSLEEMLNLSAESKENEIEERFSSIAKILLSDVAIKRGDDLFRFADIEFYFYNQYHKDIITHPRNCDAMKWYVNDFGGIDLTFRSFVQMGNFKNSQNKEVRKPVLDEQSYFGGILIRELENLQTGEELKGPWACTELFRIFDTLGKLDDYPILIEKPNDSILDEPHSRLNLKKKNQSSDKKVKYIMSVYGNTYNEREMIERFDYYENKLYRFTSHPAKQIISLNDNCLTYKRQHV